MVRYTLALEQYIILERLPSLNSILAVNSPGIFEINSISPESLEKIRMSASRPIYLLEKEILRYSATTTQIASIELGVSVGTLRRCATKNQLLFRKYEVVREITKDTLLELIPNKDLSSIITQSRKGSMELVKGSKVEATYLDTNEVTVFPSVNAFIRSLSSYPKENRISSKTLRKTMSADFANDKQGKNKIDSCIIRGWKIVFYRLP